MYFEEFEIGQKFDLNPVSVSLEEIEEFASKYDTLYLHLDKEAAEESMFKGIIASGFHTLCLVWGQWTRLNKTGTEVIAGLSMDSLRWTAPVYPNDVLTGEVEILDMISSSKSRQGVLKIQLTVSNQDGTLVLEAQVKQLLKRKRD
ncbi:MAG: MaoC/PaaZ C-terminal domain-containing protein [Peptostreptococcales bacterium]